MKILKVIHDFLPASTAGTEIYCANLASELSEKHEVILFFTAFSPAARTPRLRQGRFRGLRFYEARANRSAPDFSLSYSNPDLERIFENILREENFDLVHIHHLLYHSLGYPRIAKQRSLPVIFTLHDYYLTCPSPDGGKLLRKDHSRCPGPEASSCAECLSPPTSERNNFSARFGKFLKILPLDLFPLLSRFRRKLPLALISTLDGLISSAHFPATMGSPSEIEARQDYIHRNLIPHVDIFIAPSRHLRQRFIGFGFPAERIIYLDHGIPIESFRRRSRERAGTIRFGFAGGLIPAKGVHILVEAFSRLNDLKASLRIFGDPRLSPAYVLKLKRMARNHPISFPGALPVERVFEAYRQIDCLIVPSIWEENSPLVIHEAQAARIPVIASNIGGIPELIENDINGLLFEAGNPDDLKKMLLKIIQEPKLLELYRRNSRRIKSIEKNAEEFENIYSQFIRRKI